MTLLTAPIVYLGPTLARAAAERLLPGAILRPPIQRGDLYRDRTLRGSVFLILDGVFLQQPAVSPREIIDVMADGALVLGASSMGALRAAECWPAGMIGVGAIYRLFRRGVLTTDDEVAVLFDPDQPAKYASVALINVRYATWRAVRARQLTPALAATIVDAARELFYAERSWRATFQRAGLLSRADELSALLAPHDLKRLDATRALAWLAREERKGSLYARPLRSTRGFRALDDTRERAADALGDWSAQETKRGLVRWLGTSGRYLRYRKVLGELAVSRAQVLEELFEERDIYDEGERDQWLTRWAIREEALTPAAAQHDLPPSLALVDSASWDDLIWSGLALSRDLDRELFHLRALRQALAWAEQRALEPGAEDLRAAEAELCLAHRAKSWAELGQSHAGEGVITALLRCRRELALARVVRRHWFREH